MSHILDTSFLTILSRHKGAARAIGLLDLAAAMGLPRTAHGTRKVQAIKRDLCERGQFIGSSCIAGRAGYYLPETTAEMRETLGQYKARLRSLAVLITSGERSIRQQADTGQGGLF